MAKLRAPLAASVASASLFALGAIVSFELALPGQGVATVWLPSGIYLALLLRSTRRLWPAVIVGATAASLGVELAFAGRAVGAAGSVSLASTIEAVSGALLIQALGGAASLHRIGDVLRLVGVTLVVAALPGAVVGGVAASAQHDPVVVSAWVSWWRADVVGILVGAPAFLVSGDEWRGLARTVRGWRALEAMVIYVTLTIAAVLVAWRPPHPARPAFVMLPWFLWVTLRFGSPGLVIALVSSAVLTIRGTLAGHGPFAALPLADAVLFVQLVVSAATVCFLILTAAMRERETSFSHLRRSEQDARVRHFADTAPAVLWAADADGRRTFLSRGWEELTGQPSSSGLGSGWRGTVHADDREVVSAYADEKMRERVPYQVRYRVRTADGGYRWVMSAGRPQHDEQGTFVGYVGSLIDVHDQTVATAALARAEALLDAVFQSAPVGLAFLDRDLRFQKINERLAAINGLPIAAHIGRTPPELLPRIDDMAGIMTGFRDIVSTGQPRLGVEVSGETPATPGSRRRWRENFFPVTVAGDVVGVGVVAEDVTEQHRTEQALRESEARFRKLAEEGPVIVWVTAGDRVHYVSPRWAEYTGGTADESENVDALLDAVHPDDRPRIRHEWFEADAGTAFETEFRLRRHDGTFRWFLSRGVAMAGDKHGVQRVGAYVDIHDRKAAEQELLESGRRKDEFLAMLAHELRNPLAPIQNAVRLLEIAGPESATHVAAREIIGRQLSHIVRIVDDLLDVSRLSRGKLSIRREPTDLTAVLRDTSMDLQRLFDERHISFERVLPAEAVWTDGDRTRLAQMIGNLLHNAQKFTPAGGTVRLRLDADFERGDASIRVEDTGIGMSEDLLTRVFDEFSQGTQSLDRTPGGLGLGLALVKRFAELHGGRVAAFSDGAGRGSSFVVHLPARRSAQALATADAVAGARRSPTPGPNHPAPAASS